MQQNYRMFKEEKYDEIFSQRADTHNVNIIKKFFVFQPSSQLPHKDTSYRNMELPYSQRKNKFPAGFLPTARPQQQQLSEEQARMQVNCRKAPTNEINSFLLGLTARIKRQAQEQIDDERGISKTSPDRRIKYDEVLSNLSRIRRQNKVRPKPLNLRPSPSEDKSYSLTEDIRDTQLPHLTKRASSPSKKSTQTTLIVHTPVLKSHHSKPIDGKDSPQTDSKRKSYGSCVSERRQVCEQTGFRSNRKIITTAKISSKILKSSYPCFMKGYLAYHEAGRDLLAKSVENINDKPKYLRGIAVTARSYIAIDRYSLKVLAEKNSEEEIQIASLTKIMTCYLCLLACDKYQVNPKDVTVRVSEKAAEMPGTSAELQAGDVLTLNDLFYGLMLPSGNDASVAMAEAVGKIIQRNKKKPTKKSYYQTFIAHMNLLAKECNIEQTFQNSSGLALNPNYSTAKAISVLTSLALLKDKFREVVNTKEYEIEIKNERFGLQRKNTWRNTNKLLWKGWEGVKTGTTEAAGHCLMSCRDNLIISVYDCETLAKRFTECSKIYETLREWGM